MNKTMISARVSAGSVAILKKAKKMGMKKEFLVDKAIRKHGLEIVRMQTP